MAENYIETSYTLGRTSNTTLRILSVRGVPPPPFTDKIFAKKKVTDLGGTPRGKKYVEAEPGIF